MDLPFLSLELIAATPGQLRILAGCLWALSLAFVAVWGCFALYSHRKEHKFPDWLGWTLVWAAGLALAAALVALIVALLI